MSPTVSSDRRMVGYFSILVLALVVAAVADVVAGQDYNYDDVDSWSSASGIGDWAQFGSSVSQSLLSVPNQCDSTGRQSPVHLGGTPPGRSCPDFHEPLVRQISETDCRRDSLDFDITPHGLRAYFPLDATTCERPTLTLSNRGDPYELLFLEVHARSEHVVEGKRYDAEIQMVHAGTDRETGQLMILSLLVDASARQDNMEIEWLLRQWSNVTEQEQATCSSAARRRELFHEEEQEDRRVLRKKRILHVADYLSHSSLNERGKQQHHRERHLQFTPSPCRTDEFGNGCEPLGPRRRMFPYNLWQGIWYYGYAGSLSAPPCTENVSWRVLDEPIRISRRQYKSLAMLMTQSRNDECQLDTATSSTGENYRPIQQEEPFYFHCTSSDFGYFVYSADNQ